MDKEEEIELRRRLSESLEECKKLRDENVKLKALLRSSSLTLPSSQQSLQNTKPELSKTPFPKSDLSPNAKVSLYKSLFRGREDVYAMRWESKNGKSGYSPACLNEWDPMYCHKPCSKCKNREYLSITDLVIRNHLIGKHVAGIYPLLKDETCCFLASDFDKKTWKDDVSAFLETCRKMEIPAILECSRSGNGGHIWVFFEHAIPAYLARKLGSTILTRTMERRHQVGLDSYDRFFPNQDTMPKGGLGNLIALPLQKNAREKGGSVFLNSDFCPYPDQWKFLSSVRKIGISEVEKIVQDAEKLKMVIGVRSVKTDDEVEEDPWTLPPSRIKSEKALEEPLPEIVKVTRANMLYIAKDGLTSQLLNRFVRLAAFQNPEFYRAQAMRLSTFGKPRIINCAEEFQKHIALPRGCLDDLQAFLEQHNVPLEIKDKRFSGVHVDFSFQGTLRPEQKEVVTKLILTDNGVLVAPTGFGKTVIAAWLIAKRKTNTLILVHRRLLMDQWREQLALFLGIDTKEIGVFGGSRKKTTGRVDVAIIQSLQRKGQVQNLVADYGHVLIDECHHLSAFSFEQVLRQVKAKYILGLTATPIRKDGHHPIIIMQCGPVRAKVNPKRMAKERPFEHIVIIKNTDFVLHNEAYEPTIQELYKGITQDSDRNSMIISEVRRSIDAGRSPLVLTERTEHVAILAEYLEKVVKHVIVLKGGMGGKQRTAISERLKSISGNEERVIIATGRYIGEGFDDARLDTLFLAFPISWRGTLQQYAGRLHRLYEDKYEVRIYDFVDRYVPTFSRMYQKRLKGYHSIGYSIQEQVKQMELACLKYEREK